MLGACDSVALGIQPRAALHWKKTSKLWPPKKLQALILSSQFSLGKIEHKGMRLVLRRLYELYSLFGGCGRRPNGVGYAREGTQSPRRGKRGISSRSARSPGGTRMLRGTCQRRRDERTWRNRQRSHNRIDRMRRSSRARGEKQKNAGLAATPLRILE